MMDVFANPQSRTSKDALCWITAHALRLFSIFVMLINQPSLVGRV